MSKKHSGVLFLQKDMDSRLYGNAHPAKTCPGLDRGWFWEFRRIACRSTAIAMAALLAVAAAPAASAAAKTEPAHVAAQLSRIDVNDGFAELVKAVKPAVVNISVTSYVDPSGSGNRRNQGQPPQQLEEFFRRFFGDSFNFPRNRPEDDDNSRNPYPERRSAAVGSGFIVDPDGFVVTNYHVIEDADEIEVVLDDGTRLPATLKGTDEKTDLALLEISVDGNLPWLEFGNSNEARVGDWVIAIGNPFGLGGTTTSGIISARGRDLRAGQLVDFIQIDASINRGNSGGPLFNTRGQVIGINSVIYSPNGGNIGIGFAIPSAVASDVIAQLQQTGVVERGYLGVQIQALTAEIAESLGLQDESGALVTEVVEDSPAWDAGIESGDVILEYDGKKVTTMRDLPKLVARTARSQQVEIGLWRNNSDHSVKVTVGSIDRAVVASSGEDRPEDRQLGLGLAALDRVQIEKYGLGDVDSGVVIVDIDPQSPAAQRGLREGDVIKQVGVHKVSKPDDVLEAIRKSKEDKKESVLLLVRKDNYSRFVVVPLKA